MRETLAGGREAYPAFRRCRTLGGPRCDASLPASHPSCTDQPRNWAWKPAGDGDHVLLIRRRHEWLHPQVGGEADPSAQEAGLRRLAASVSSQY
jgi:hypothetical protein